MRAVIVIVIIYSIRSFDSIRVCEKLYIIFESIVSNYTITLYIIYTHLSGRVGEGYRDGEGKTLGNGDDDDRDGDDTVHAEGVRRGDIDR